MASRNLLLFITAVLGLLSSVQGITNHEALQLCKDKTTIPVRNFAEANLKNDNCAIDCITHRGAFLTIPIREKDTCSKSTDNDYLCLFGRCRFIDTAAVSTSNLYALEIRVKKAHFVLDANAGSDIFINVIVQNGGSPTYDNEEIVCKTNSVRDKDQPEWDGFVCKPLPMNKDTELEFVALNRSGESSTPQILGKASKKVKDLMHGESTKLEMEGDQHIIVKISGKEYKE